MSYIAHIPGACLTLFVSLDVKRKRVLDDSASSADVATLASKTWREKRKKKNVERNSINFKISEKQRKKLKRGSNGGIKSETTSLSYMNTLKLKKEEREKEEEENGGERKSKRH